MQNIWPNKDYPFYLFKEITCPFECWIILGNIQVC